jgi:hypothetical protein
MPTLEQKEDGDYYIRAYSHSKGCIVTWQVRGSGLTYLNRHGVYAGQTFSTKLLQDLIVANGVFTGGSGSHMGNAVKQRRSLMPITVPMRNTSSMNISLPGTSTPQKSQDNGRPATLIRKSTSFVFRKYKNRWELLMVFPQLLLDDPKELLTSGCRLTVVGATHALKAKQLLRGRGEASLTVRPQMDDYAIKLNGTGSSCENLWSLLKESKNIIHEVKGLSSSGTVFKKHKEALPFKEGIRLYQHEPMILGHSYFVVFHKAYEPKSVPHALTINNLGNIGMWEAWEIRLPLKTETVLGSWCAGLGHVLHD